MNGIESILRGVVGLFLLAADGLKLYGLKVAPFAQYGWLQSSTVQFAAL